MLKRLGSSDSGLTGQEAADRLSRDGLNVVSSHRASALTILWGQLRNPLLLLLLVAALVSGLTGDATDAIIIAVIVALSVGLGFVNEYRAELAVQQLHAKIRHEAVVWRDGQSAEHRRDAARARRRGGARGSGISSPADFGCWRPISWNATRAC